MVSKRSNDIDAEEAPAWTRLLDIELKLKGIAYLIETQGSDPCPPLPCDIEDIVKGQGMILGELASDIAEIRRELDEASVQCSQSTKNNKAKRK